ncbi:MAG: hypothetical protein E7015_00470 [Alphaproteobacteria bacterium]|nr:hypothetical protein [Alphaproteobacteria bacterium]
MLYHQIVESNCFRGRSNFDFFNDITKLDCCSIVRKTEDLEALDSPRFTEWLKLKNFLIFGTGGSSLCGQTICSALKKTDKNIRFVSNLDPFTLENVMSSSDFENTGFLFISKSGETLETITQLLLIIEATSSLSNFSDRFVIITENKDSTLKELADKNKFICFDHPTTIGGRYSVFSLVGMIPAVICGQDPRSIRSGGRRVLDNFGNSIYKIQEGSDFVFQATRNHISNHVSFIYSDKLTCFGAWLAQLYAESSGKNSKGITPLTAIGAVDQHSQLQLYLEGPKDKCFTFFYERQERSPILSSSGIPDKFTYLVGKSISTVFESQCSATMKTLIDINAHIRRIETPPIDAVCLGALFMHFITEVICVCMLMDVNPFDQPAVEKGKIITKELLESK